MASFELTSAIALAALAFLAIMLLSAPGRTGQRRHSEKALRKELGEISRAQVNRALAITFITIVGLLTMPLLAATATGDITAFDGKVGVLALLAFFTASYAIIAIHAVIGRD
jgi:predicted MFS family arabinose efflux permease